MPDAAVESMLTAYLHLAKCREYRHYIPPRYAESIERDGRGASDILGWLGPFDLAQMQDGIQMVEVEQDGTT